MSFKLSKIPEADIQWGSLQQNSKKEIEDWGASNLRSFLLTFNLPINVLTNRDEDVKQFGKALFDEIRSVGYSEGYESAEVSAAENAEGF